MDKLLAYCDDEAIAALANNHPDYINVLLPAILDLVWSVSNNPAITATTLTKWLVIISKCSYYLGYYRGRDEAQEDAP